MSTLEDGIIIKGLTTAGKAFRPSDWAERLCGVMRCFERDQQGYNHITYSEYVRPTLFEGVKSVIVHHALEEIKPEAYRFFLEFAENNKLQVVDLPSTESQGWYPSAFFISQITMKKILLIVMCVMSLTACKQTTSQTQVTATQINAELAARQAVLLDVRTLAEYHSGRVRNALLVPYDSIAQTILTVAPDKNQTIYLYCRSGRRSGIASDTLKGMGYTRVVNLGGLSDLTQYGLTVEK